MQIKSYKFLIAKSAYQFQNSPIIYTLHIYVPHPELISSSTNHHLFMLLAAHAY
jgi:hypothetical protein